MLLFVAAHPYSSALIYSQIDNMVSLQRLIKKLEFLFELPMRLTRLGTDERPHLRRVLRRN
jgi:hypothetical protein